MRLFRNETYSKIGQLQGHLDVGIWTNAAVFHEALSVRVVQENPQIDVVQQTKRSLQIVTVISSVSRRKHSGEWKYIKTSHAVLNNLEFIEPSIGLS